MKVLYFLIADCGHIGMLTYWAFKNFYIIIILVVQLYMSFSVLSFWRTLVKEYETRRENREIRNRRERAQRRSNPTSAAALNEPAVSPENVWKEPIASIFSLTFTETRKLISRHLIPPKVIEFIFKPQNVSENYVRRCLLSIRFRDAYQYERQKRVMLKRLLCHKIMWCAT